MAAAVSLDTHDFSLAEARLCWNRAVHLRHEVVSACHEARQLSLQISAQLQAHLFNSPVDFPSLARSLHIPHPSLRRLLALADPAPAPPACTLTGCDFSLRLDPPDWSRARRCLELLSPIAFDISRSIADAFTSQTNGPLRDQLRQLHRAHPLDFLPERVAALAPISVPALPATPVTREPLPLDSDQSISHSWRRLQALRRSRRFARHELTDLHPRLARLIFVHWQIYAQPGRSSAFSAWLRMAGIPRSSAYRLLRQFHPHEGDFAPIPPPPQDLNCPETAASLHQGKLLVRLSPQHATIVHCALSGLLAHNRPFNPAAIVVSHLASCVPPADRASLDSLYRSPPSHFPRFLPPLRILTPASPA